MLGIKLIATKYEIAIAKLTVIAKLSKNLPTIPLMFATGTKTESSIADIATTGKAISLAPSTAA